MQIIPIFLTFDRYYVVAAEVAIYSMLKHASADYTYYIYVLHSDIPVKSQDKLRKVIRRFPNAAIHFIHAEELEKKYPMLQGKKHFSKEIFYKLVAAEIFPQYDRVICTDVDVLFVDDISSSYFMFPDQDFYFAGVGQTLESGRMASYEKDFNEDEIKILRHEIMAGYLLINLKYIREKGKQQLLTDFYTRNFSRLQLPEQDAIVLCCWPEIAYLPLKYVACNNLYQVDEDALVFFPENEEFAGDRETALRKFRDTLAHPVQIHYVGPRKPWNSFGVPKQGMWFAYLKETGAVADYLRDYPRQAVKQLRRLSLKRFCGKVLRRLRGAK